MNFETKDINQGPSDVDVKTRKVKVVLNRTGVLDHDNDIIQGDAFNKTIRERGPQGKGLIWHLTDHNPSLKTAIARFTELSMQGPDLVGVTDIPKTTWGNDMLEMYDTGNINQHSIGYRTIKREIVNEGKDNEHSILKEIMLYEGSAVPWGANEYTPTLSVGKSLTKEEVTSEYSKTLEELNKLTKLFKTGHLSDESFELVDLKIQQLTDKLQRLFEVATQPDAKSVEPETEGWLNVLETFTNNLKTANDDRARKERCASPA